MSDVRLTFLEYADDGNITSDSRLEQCGVCFDRH